VSDLILYLDKKIKESSLNLHLIFAKKYQIEQDQSRAFITLTRLCINFCVADQMKFSFVDDKEKKEIHVT